MFNSKVRTLAENDIQATSGALRDFKATHFHLFTEGFEKGTKILGDFLDILDVKHKGDVDADLTHFMKSTIPTVIYVDGVLKATPKLDGVTFGNITDPSFLVSDKNRSDIFSHLHHTFFKSLHVIDIKKDMVLKSPLRILKIHTKSGLESDSLVIVANRLSSLTIIEETISLDGHFSHLGETHIMADEGSKVEHLEIFQGTPASSLHGVTFAHLQKDANYRHIVFHVKGKRNDHKLDLHLHAPGAHGESMNLYLLNAQERSNINTVINHYTPDSTSSQLAKGILDGESKGTFTGRIHIFKDAQRVKSSQLNKNLLLSKKAQAFSEPQLEIFADDVKCSHGSTTGQLSPEEIFYFEARGIPHEKARNLLALAFGMEVVLKTQNPEARAYVQELIGTELKNKFQLGGTP
jgi:Fe-S cluster assembly protein SufD